MRKYAEKLVSKSLLGCPRYNPGHLMESFRFPSYYMLTC